MVTGEFLRELQQVRDVFRWELRGDLDEIRGFLRTGETGTSFNPIAALAFVRSGRAFGAGDWLSAARILGLTESDAEAIIDGSNNCLWKYVDGELALSAYSQWIRAELIDAIGLEPDFDGSADLTAPEATGEVIVAEEFTEAELHHV